MKVGIAFSGGGLRGAYQVGAYKAFRDLNIKVDGFVGTSIGAFNACMCASGKFLELYDFWSNMDAGEILGFSKELVDSANHDKIDVIEILKNIKNIISNRGISTIGLKEKLKEFHLEKYLYESKKDFGLVTVRFNDFKPRYLLKKDIDKKHLNEYILASCYLPVFKLEKMIDNNYYLDGGFHDYIPANMLINMGYDKIYVIDLEAIGLRRPYKDRKKIVVIKPRKKLYNILDFKKKDIDEMIKMGYYDTLRVLKDFDGKKYIFKKRRKWYYKYLLKFVDKDIVYSMSKLFGTKDEKRLVIKVVEYVMKKEGFTYYNVYRIKDVIKRIRFTRSDSDVYKFVKSLGGNYNGKSL